MPSQKQAKSSKIDKFLFWFSFAQQMIAPTLIAVLQARSALKEDEPSVIRSPETFGTSADSILNSEVLSSRL